MMGTLASKPLYAPARTIEQMTPAYNAANSFAAAVRGVPVQKSLEDGPVIREVEA